jgi:hypothetical protein
MFDLDAKNSAVDGAVRVSTQTSTSTKISDCQPGCEMESREYRGGQVVVRDIYQDAYWIDPLEEKAVRSDVVRFRARDEDGFGFDANGARLGFGRGATSVDPFRVSQELPALGCCCERCERPPKFLPDRSRLSRLVSRLVSRRGDNQSTVLVSAPGSCTPDAWMRSVDSVGKAAHEGWVHAPVRRRQWHNDIRGRSETRCRHCLEGGIPRSGGVLPLGRARGSSDSDVRSPQPCRHVQLPSAPMS